VGAAVKRVSLCVLGLLIGSAAVLPLTASAGTGLQVLVFITPEGRIANQTVDVNLEAYFDGTPVDLDTIDVSAGYSGDPLTFDRTSVGKYHATYTINVSQILFGGISLVGSADKGADSASIITSYAVSGATVGWDITVRVSNFGVVGPTVSPGQTVELEARSYHDGTLAEGGMINFTLEWMEGSTNGTETPTSTKVQDGVYKVSVVVPASLTLTRTYNVEAKLGTSIFSPSSSTGFGAHPFPIYSLVTAGGPTSATLKVFAGGATALAGANVSLEGWSISLSPPFGMARVGPFTATTDANGQATLTASWGLSPVAIWYLNVTSGGKTTSAPVTLMTSASSAWIPTPAIGFGCEVNLQTDPSGLHAGQTANLVFRVTYAASILNPQPVASQGIDRYVWREGEGGTSQAGSVMTDASGNFTLTYAIPANWTGDDSLKVRVVCPSGSAGSTQVQVGSGNPFGSGAVVVTASGKLGEAVTITATYSGTNPLTGAVAYAAIVPGNQTNIGGVGLSGGALNTALTRSGSTFTGTITVPAWLGEGDYSVLVLITNEGATSSTTDQTTEGNATTMHLSPQGSTGGNNPAPRGFLPGFEGAAAVAAIGGGAFALLAARRRRVA